MKQLACITIVVLSLWVTVLAAYNCNPACQNGECTAYLGELSCQCQGNWSGDACHISICEAENPCNNSGICAMNPSNISEYVCACPLGYTGNRCQHKVPGKQSAVCLPDTCNYNGSCYESQDPSGFYCECFDGYYGPSCNFTTNPCSNEDCQGRGYCSVAPDLVGDAKANCTCDFPYHPIGSKMCSQLDGSAFCEGDYFSCADGSECNYVRDEQERFNFTCTCPPDKTGRLCDQDFDVCSDSPNAFCYNNGVCVSAGHYFSCDCPPNYTGDHCQFIIDPCLGHSCQNEATCVVDSQVTPNQLNLYDTQLGSINYSCECVCGYFGLNCENSVVTIDYCASSPCDYSNTESCINLADGFVCTCNTGWGGPTCEQDLDECFDNPNPCNGHNCTNTPGGYSCECSAQWTGENCQRPVTCDDVDCLNSGICREDTGQAECFCHAGFTGIFCETQECLLPECELLASNGVCNEHCYTAACGFDGGDCYSYTNSTLDLYSSCRTAPACRALHGNGICNVECNTRECLYDGLDCVPAPGVCPTALQCEAGTEDGVCDAACNTADCPYDTLDCGRQLARNTLVLIILANPFQPFENPWREEFLIDIGRITNTAPVVESVRLITREELAGLVQQLVIFPAEPLVEDLLIYQVELKLDLNYCNSQCPSSADDAADWINAVVNNGDLAIGPYGLAAVYTVPDSSSTPAGVEVVYGLVGLGVVLVVIVVLVIVVLRKRQRSYETTEHNPPKRIKAPLWVPKSPSEQGAAESSPTNKKRTSANGVTKSQSTRPDHYITEGSHRANMDPPNSTSQIDWTPVTTEIKGGASPNEDNNVITGQVGTDKRNFTPAHIEALNGPHRVRELVDVYRRQSGSTNNINTAGPGGFTPLMLVIMKRHSSRENVYQSRSSSESGGSDEQSMLLPPATQQHMRRDQSYYTQHSQADSSVSALIDAKVNLDMQNDCGQTALHLACICSRGSYVDQLLEAGANPNVQDNWGQSALQAAIGAAAEGAFMILVNHPRTDLSLKSNGGVTPLIAAVKVVNQFMVKELLKKNVDIGTPDSDGRTAVHWAAMVENLDALKLLIRQGPDAIKDAQDSKGQTALFLACREGSLGCVKHLLDCFANATLMDNLEQSPLQIAYQKQHLDIVDMLRGATQGAFPMHSQQHMRGIPGGFPMAAQYSEDFSSHQLVHPKKSKVKRNNSHMDMVHTPTFISNMHSETPPYYIPTTTAAERHQTFGDLNMPPSSIPMSNYGLSSLAPTSQPLAHSQMSINTSDYSKTSPVAHNNGFPHPITPPDSATLKVNTAPYSSSSPGTILPPSSLSVSTAPGFGEDIIAMTDLITSMADNPPVTTGSYRTFPNKTNTVYPETSVGGTFRLQHYPMMDQKQQAYPGDPSPPAASAAGSPSSVYPSPPHSNELQQNTLYHDPQSYCSPPSLTPSPESKEEALARQKYNHEIMTESFGTVLESGPHQMYQPYNMSYRPLESSV